MYRAEIGAWVRNRLSNRPDVFKLPAKKLDIFLARDVLTPKECAGVMRMIDADRRPSELLTPTDDPEFRTSESCDLDYSLPLVRTVEDKVNAFMGIQPNQGEGLQGQRYDVGQQFKPHHDFFYLDQPYWQEMDKVGGQRTWTAMVFLNEPKKGGQTFFEHAGVRVSPKAGNLLTWNNLDENGDPNMFALHQGMPVLEGLKYVITKWYRERPWCITIHDELPPPAESQQ